jgi:hypothetical protein
MEWGLILTIGAVVVAGLAAVVGLWMERDPNRPPRWAWSLTFLILITTIVTIVTSYNDKLEGDAAEAAAAKRYDDIKRRAELLQDGNERLEEAAGESKDREEKMGDDIARMLVKLNDMAKDSTDPKVQEMVKAEMAAQSRGNEAVVGKIAQQVKDKGGDPDAVLAAVLPEEELQRVKRNLKQKEERMDVLLDKKAARQKERALREEAEEKEREKKGKKRGKDDKGDDKDKERAKKEREKEKKEKEKAAESAKPAVSAPPVPSLAAPAPSGSVAALTSAAAAPPGSAKAPRPKRAKKENGEPAAPKAP